jgi:hypothetical protein
MQREEITPTGSFSRCTSANLFGQYLNSENADYFKGMTWLTFRKTLIFVSELLIKNEYVCKYYAEFHVTIRRTNSLPLLRQLPPFDEQVGNVDPAGGFLSHRSAIKKHFLALCNNTCASCHPNLADSLSTGEIPEYQAAYPSKEQGTIYK